MKSKRGKSKAAAKEKEDMEPGATRRQVHHSPAQPAAMPARKKKVDVMHDLHPIFTACDEGRLEEVKRHLESGVDPNIRHPFHISLGAAALHTGNMDLLRLLIKHGYAVNRSSGAAKKTLLHVAVEAPDGIKFARVLLEAGANPNLPNDGGDTPVSRAAATGNLEMLDLLLAAGGDPHHVSEDGTTPLYQALMNPDTACARRLLTYGGDVHCLDPRSQTALHWAAIWGNAEHVKELLELGLDPTLKDHDDQTPLDLARERGFEEIVKLLS